MITLTDIQKTGTQNISINNSVNINNSMVFIISPEKVELQPGLIALVSLMALILLIMTAILLLPKSIQDNVFQLVLHQTPDQTFNYIDVGLYKTRHSIYRKEVYSLAMQGNQSKKKFEAHTLLSSNNNINSSRSKHNNQSKETSTKPIISSVSVSENYNRPNQCSSSSLISKHLFPLDDWHLHNQSSQMKNTKSVMFTENCCSDVNNNDDSSCTNYRENSDSNIFASTRRNSTPNVINDTSVYASMDITASLSHIRYSLPSCFTQSNQSINSPRSLTSLAISPNSKQLLSLNKRVRLQLSDTFINGFK
ncbi:hypothetical protein MS3_00004172 [Schistosoma haematobium]|uniref:Uncharacterized protein n=1 Tax=Schistosoma haematobium TaxID=6185 RepID=A0A094ZM29_SCHHA|nr:hypothetical protein MS3_00004172 [Schistosoma haematobium]KAH9592144.1 hypothetical protein MS3_00004172 [Schistosoma haematobium]CAH8675673.1 unnamed protein product [Schistosoma haematobium]